MRGCRPRRDPRAVIASTSGIASHSAGVRDMKNFVAPLSFTIAAAWVVVLFVLVSNT
jgi:hypothetical protein